MGFYGYKEKQSSLFEGIAIVGVAETAAVDINMADTNVKTGNNPSPTKPMQSSRIPDWKCDDRNDCCLTYKRRKGDISKTQLDCMDKEAVLHFNTENAGVIKTSKFKDEEITYDYANLGGETMVPTQPQISSHKINVNRQQEVPINNIKSGNTKSASKDKATLKPNPNLEIQTSKLEEKVLKDDCATLVGRAEVLLQPCISSIYSVVENITKLCDAKSEQKEAQILDSRLKPERTANKVGDFKVNNLLRTKSSCPNNEKIHHEKQKTDNARKVCAAVIGDEIVDIAVPASAANAVGSKTIPLFESFIVEEEEGSGGYGTVYKARRKQDGKIFAIKCPLEKTSTNYVTNEIKMLERFHGKKFIIKYEGSFKYNECDCLILQHIEHDKPEVLKREINVSQLRWYGYCMFRALQSLHKEGIIHRDIKPGNFLFSRKSNRGYLIDFNLAMDQLDINFGRSKSKILLDNKKSTVSTASHKPQFFTRKDTPDLRQKALLAAADATAVAKRQAYNKSSSNGLNSKWAGQAIEIKQQYSSNHKAQSKLHPDKIEINHRIKSGERSVPKVSGLHLVASPSKEITSAHTPSGGNKREPLPNQGRKELLNLIHEAQQTPQQQSTLIPFSQRKRVAAPRERVRRDNGYTMNASPMPIQSKLCTSAYGLNGTPKNRDNQKFKKEGPCVGTKGYRAPEVLLRSLHQGCKVDIWSAGVSLLYMIAGKTPFQTGSPEQAIKDIAKIRGMEEIWELAKLHDRETSLPEDLYSNEFENMSVQEWCRKNTKRPDLFENTPPSLYDLIDKCLCVNPRQRIDASEALQHEFFAPCCEARRSSSRSRSRESVLTE